MGTQDSLEAVVGPAVEAAGYNLVRLRLMGAARKTLQVMAERSDGHMDVEDCTRLSRVLSDVLEAADPIAGEYVLEVSSPGIDRPLTRDQDYARFSGHEARIELSSPVHGRRRLKGLLIGLDAGDVVLDVATNGSVERMRLPLEQIADARLVLTDRLIQESLKARDLMLKDTV